MLYQRKYSPIAILFVILSPWLITLSGCNRYTESTDPATPLNFQASPADSSITLSWTAVSGASSYNIYWSKTSGEGTAGTAISGIDGTTYTLSDLTDGTTYYVVVTSQEGSTESAPSNQVSVIPNKYIKVDSGGAELPSTATEWDCVQDIGSGLMWEKKTDDDGLRDEFWNYTWYDSNPATNAGYVGSPGNGICFDDSNCDTEKYAAQVNATGGICGYTDWRMPTEDDLAGLLTCYYPYCDTEPTINQTYYPNTLSSYYWSSSVFASSAYMSWSVNFGLGEVAGGNKDGRAHVRLVRGGQPLAIGITGSGTVSDKPDVVAGCSADCTQYYPDGEVVTLTAISPNQYYWATKWSGCDSATTTECTVTMNGARGVAVNITQIGVDLTKVNSSGVEVASDATEWVCVLDNASGLLWEVKTDDGGLRDTEWTYSWYDSNPDTNGGDAGTADGGNCVDTTNCDTEKFAEQVNDTGGICGYTDWRMPTEDELGGLLNCVYGEDCNVASAPLLDQAYFPNTQSVFYWSWTTETDVDDTAQGVYFSSGQATGLNKAEGNDVRLVRSVPPVLEPPRLSVTNAIETEITLSWNSVNETTSYNLYGSQTQGAGTSGSIEISGLLGTSYTLGGLTVGSTYYFVVTSQRDSEESAASNEVSAMPGKYIKVDSGGAELPSTATEWDCVQDNDTNLMWEVKTDDDGLRDTGWTYTWYDTDTATNGGNAGTADGGTCFDTTNCDTEKFAEQVNNGTGGICGYTDWRIPTQDELGSLLTCDYPDCLVGFDPHIDQSYFPYTQSNKYWSSLVYSSSANIEGMYAYDVDFGAPEKMVFSVAEKSSPENVRLVRDN